MGNVGPSDPTTHMHQAVSAHIGIQPVKIGVSLHSLSSLIGITPFCRVYSQVIIPRQVLLDSLDDYLFSIV